MADQIDLCDLTDEEADLVKSLVEVLRRRHPHRQPDRSDEEREREWARVASAAFSKDWDNESDAVYDNWRERYCVPER